MTEPSRARVRPLVNSASSLITAVLPSASENSTTRLPGMSLKRSTPRAGDPGGSLDPGEAARDLLEAGVGGEQVVEGHGVPPVRGDESARLSGSWWDRA